MKGFSERLLCLLSYWVLALAYLNSALAAETLNVGYVEFPPYEYTDESGTPAGSFIEVTRKTLERAGYQAEFVALPITRTYLYLQEGKIDLWPGLSGIPALQGYVLESEAVPTVIRLNAWFLKGTPPIANIDDMKGHGLILISGYTYGGLLYRLTDPDSGFQILYSRTHTSALQMLEKRRGEYLLDYVEPIRNTLEDSPLADLQSVPLNTRNASFIVSRKAPNAETILRRLDRAYAELLREGKVHFIRED